jgi:hypothetical protein
MPGNEIAELTRARDYWRDYVRKLHRVLYSPITPSVAELRAIVDDAIAGDC